MSEFKAGDRHEVLVGRMVTVRECNGGVIDGDGDVRVHYYNVAPEDLRKIDESTQDEPSSIIPARLEALRAALDMGLDDRATVEAARFLLGEN